MHAEKCRSRLGGAEGSAINDRMAVPFQRAISSLREIFPAGRLFVDDAHLAAYESDGLTAFKAKPRAVVVPGTDHNDIGLAVVYQETLARFLAIERPAG